MGKGNVRNRFRFHYRFTFFQRQFLSHLTISLSVLLLLGLGATYYIKHETYKNKEDELKSASRAVIRLLQQEENPADLLAVYRAVLSERGIFFVVLDKSGEVILKDPRMQSQAYFRSKTFLDSLRQHMYTNDAHYFIIEKQTAPLMVWPRVFKANTSKTDAFLFMISPVQGVKETLRAINQTIVYTAILVFALAMLASWVVSRSMSRGVKGCSGPRSASPPAITRSARKCGVPTSSAIWREISTRWRNSSSTARASWSNTKSGGDSSSWTSRTSCARRLRPFAASSKG